MAYYDSGAWSPASRQGPWDQSSPISRQGSTPTSVNDDPEAFYYQKASVDRAVETWRKASKMPNDPRGAVTPRFPPAAEFDPMRPLSGGNVQNFYGTPRYGSRPTEVDAAMQVKRRMAAQRERDLRNYHQEQQFQKHLSSAKSDRSMSPNTGMSEDERRELIARQHRALYGNESNLYSPTTTDSSAVGPPRPPPGPPGQYRPGPGSPYDGFPGAPGSGVQSPGGEGPIGTPKDPNAPQQPQLPPSRSAATSPSSPPGAAAYGGMFPEVAQSQQQQVRPASSSPTGGRGGASPPATGPGKSSSTAPSSAAVNPPPPLPIGTRPAAGSPAQQIPPSQQQHQGQNRSGTPGSLASPMGYDQQQQSQQQEQGSSGAPAGDKTEDGAGKVNSGTPTSGGPPPGNLRGGWGNGGVWGGKGGLGVQAKVWG